MHFSGSQSPKRIVTILLKEFLATRVEAFDNKMVKQHTLSA